MGKSFVEKLCDRAYAERAEFIEGLRGEVFEEIVASAYEIIMTEEILYIFEYELSEEEAKLLLKIKKPLHSCYNEWLGTDGSAFATDYLRDCVREYAQGLAKKEAAK